MEIISYFDSKNSFALPMSAPSLEDMLRAQVTHKKKDNRRQKEVSQKKGSVQKEHSVSFDSDIFFNNIVKLRYALIAIAFLFLVAVGGVSVMIYTKTFASPVDFHQAVLVEEEVLTESMHSFVSLGSSAYSYEEDESIAILSELNSSSLYTQPVSFQNYTVQSGDSIHSISTRFGLDNISTLIGVNNIENVRLLRSGQKIIVPSIDGLIYNVKKGDSLEKISSQYSVTIEEILDVNELDSSILQIGETLFIPGARLDTTSLRQAMGELFKHPLSGRWRLSSNYGNRADPFTGVRSFHTGADFAIAKGTPVRSAMSGTVSTAGYSSIYGYYVIVNHHNGYQTLYAHFMEAAPVKKGQSVSQNTIVGYVGSTGYSTGNHLHFSVYKDGKLVSPRTVINY